jgi:hypothetical protein
VDLTVAALAGRANNANVKSEAPPEKSISTGGPLIQTFASKPAGVGIGPLGNYCLWDGFDMVNEG